jgi:hypothetical protein
MTGLAQTSDEAVSEQANEPKFRPEKIWTIRDLIGNPYGRTHLTALVSSGRLKAKRDGRYIMIKNSDWLAYLDSLPNAAVPSARRALDLRSVG